MDADTVAQLVKAATDAAAAAAKAASSSSAPTHIGRLVKQPTQFGAVSSEQEHREWRQWKLRFTSWIALQSPPMYEMLDRVEAHPDSEVAMVDLDPEQTAISLQLHSLLLAYTQGNAFRIVEEVRDCCGGEAYRRLLCENEPRTTSRAAAIMECIMSYQPSSKDLSIRQRVAEIEVLFDTYRSTTGSEVDNIMKVAILMRLLKPELKRHVQLQISDTTTYAKVRDLITDYDRATASWAVETVRPVGGIAAGDGVTPMEVDRVNKGKGKDKGKGKGKGKGKDQFAKGKGKDKGKGKQTGSSQYEQQQRGKGKEANKGKGNMVAMRQSCATFVANLAMLPVTVGKDRRMSGMLFLVGKVAIIMYNFEEQSNSVSESQPFWMHDQKKYFVQTVACGSTCFHDMEQQTVGVDQHDMEHSRVEHFDISLSDNDGNWDTSSFEHSFMNLTGMPDLHVWNCNAVSSGEPDLQDYVPHEDFSGDMPVVVDTGADISVAPLWCRDFNADIRNASGELMPTEAMRRLSVRVQDDSGTHLDFTDFFAISNVRQPILAVGQILHVLGQPSLQSPDGAVNIRLQFRHNSLEVSGRVHAIQVRPVEVSRGSRDPEPATIPERPELCVGQFVKLGDAWSELAPGWNVLPAGHVVHLEQKTDKLTDPHPVWKSRPYRTCLASMDGKDWKVITLNEAWGNLADAQAVYTGVPRRLITVVTEKPLELKTLWMSKEEMEAILVEQQDQALEESVEPKPVEGEVDDEEAEVPGFADVDLPTVEVEGVPIDAAPNRLIVNGEEITAESSLRKMREAAKFLKVAIGGAKSKVWAKLVNCHLQAAAGAVDAAAALALRGEQVDPVMRARPREPSVRERELHEVTHQPYMPWCEACVASRADAHPSAVEPDDDVQDMAVIQCDFMYPGNEADEEKSADAPGADEAEGSKWLVAADKHSHALLCVPVEQKGGSSLARMVQELYNFILRVSSTAVTIQGDQEPALQAVLRGVQQMRDRQQFGRS